MQRMEAGREFLKRGAEHEKDLSPNYFFGAFLTVKRVYLQNEGQ